MSEEFIGSGWAFPLRTDATGRIALVSREQEIEESMRLILGTAIGERPMRPEFGCEIHDYVFESADAETAARVAAAVRASLRRWEPRIEVRDVVASFDSAAIGSALAASRASTMAVWMGPGAMALQRMARGAHSRASTFASMCRPALATE